MAGNSQSSNSQTLDTLTNNTPTDEATLAAQQTEINQLRALLQAAEARAAQAPSTQSIEQVATTLAETIACSIERSLAPHHTAKKTKAIPDLDPLTDGKEPTFDNWKI
jgi:hypothetical protein